MKLEKNNLTKMKLEDISHKQEAYRFLDVRFNEIKDAVHNGEDSIPDKVDKYRKIQISLKRKYHLNTDSHTDSLIELLKDVLITKYKTIIPQQNKLIENHKKELEDNPA